MFSTRFESLIERLNNGDATAVDDLIQAACHRLRVMAHDLLRADRVHRWEDTDDVLQEALISLRKSLLEVELRDGQDFIRLAALHIRRSLIRFARHYFGPLGLAANHDSPHTSDPTARIAHLPDDRSESPEEIFQRAERLARLHQAVDDLPDQLREVTDLIWFHELPRAHVGKLLGVDERTVRRRWQRARLALHAALQDSS